MKNFVLNAFFLVALSFVFAGCGNDDDPTPDGGNTGGGEDNTEELALLIGSWNGDDDICGDAVTSVYTFNEDGTYNVNCDGDVYGEGSEYQLSQDGNTLTLENMATQTMDAWTVETLTETDLVISRNGATITGTRQQ